MERNHYIVCVVEVKRNLETEVFAEDQMTRYMEQAADLPLREENLEGFLIMGSTVRAYRLEDLGLGVEAQSDQTFAVSAPGDQLTRQLCEISVRNWNFQS